MKKINILKNNRDFNRIIKNQNCFKSKYFVIYKENINEPIYHFGFSVSKKVGNAVIRNKIKRQLRSIISEKDYQNNFNCIIIVRKAILDLNYQQREFELLKIIDKVIK